MSDAPGSLNAALAGRYRLERELGAGGMATVYLAQDLKHDRPVALKVLRPELAASLGAERFLAEIRLTAKLQHPHIVPLFDSGEAGGFLYYVMPYIEGESLRTRLEREQRLDVEAMLAVARPVAQALAYAHEAGVVHRDIKPENILVSRGQPFVTDFGIARAVTVAAGERLTATGVAIGTPAYMSPEQALGEEGVDARSDVYSLGCVIYEVLVGEPPFSGATMQALIARRLAGPPPHLTNVPAAVDEVVRRSLATAPQDRFATAVALADALVEAARRPATPELSLVVLPFENLSPDPDNAFFADGLTEELIATLSKVRALRVISRTSAMHYKGTTQPLPEIARELNVRYVIEGSVRRAANSLRITAQLIDSATDAHLWAEKYAGTLDDVFDLQEKVSRAIVAALEVHLSPQEDRKLAARPLPNAAAYDSYLRAYQDFMLFEPAALKRAEQYLQSASELVGEHPLVLVGRSMVRFQYVNLGLGTDETLKESRDLAERALALDPTLARAHGVLAMICILEGDLPKGIGHARKARAEAPWDTTAWGWLPWYYLCVGKVAAAAQLTEEVRRLDPAEPNWNFFDPLLALFSADFEEGARRMAEARGKISDSPMARFWEPIAEALAGHRDAALEALAPLTANPAADSLGHLGHMLRAVLRGDVAEFDAHLTPELVASLRRDCQYSYHMAGFTAALGRREDALDWLENAVDRTFVPVTLFEADPFLAPLRGDPRFERILARARRVQASVPDEP